MTPPMNENGGAYVVPDERRSPGQEAPAPSPIRIELTPWTHGTVVVAAYGSDSAVTSVLIVSAHTLVRAAVAAALDALEAPQSPRTGAGEHDPSRTEQFRTEPEQEN